MTRNEKALQHLLLLAIFSAVIVITLKQFLKLMGPVRPYSPDQLPGVFAKVQKIYGTEYARNVERLFRQETAHFKSKQFLTTLSPGMEAVKSTFPFGWSLATFLKKYPEYGTAANYGRKQYQDNHIASHKPYFVSFPSVEASVMFVAWFIKNIRGGDFGQWNSRVPAEALAYTATISQIKPRFV